MYFLVAILMIVVIIFGVSSGMQSYATAQQAQAQIEVAKVAQVNAWGNLVTILMFLLIILIVFALIAAALWLLYKRSAQRSSVHAPRVSTATHSTPVENQPQLTMQDLLQLEMLRAIRSLHAPNSNAPALPAPHEEQEVSTDDPFYWLR